MAASRWRWPGVLLWGIAQGVHDAVMNAAIATFVPEHLRARAYGLFLGAVWHRLVHRQRGAGTAV